MTFSTIKNLILPLIAVVSLVLAIASVLASPPDQSDLPPPSQPLSSPESNENGVVVVAGTGLIESSSEDITIGSHLSGIVDKVLVAEGDYVKQGAPLFKLDTRDAEAKVMVREAQLLTAQSRLANSKAQLGFYESVRDKAAISKEEFSRRRYDAQINEALVAEAKANLEDANAHLALHTVVAPIAGEILQVDIKNGEFAQAGQSGATPLMRLGDTTYLHARIDVDEFDINQLHDGLTAKISPKGNTNIQLAGQLVSIEPFVRPKTTLSGSARELIDTRVLQLIFRIEDKNAPLYVGQQVDAYLKSNQNKPMIAVIKTNKRNAK